MTDTTTPTATPAQAAFARRHGFRQDPATGTYEATMGWVNASADIRVAVRFDPSISAWVVLVEDRVQRRGRLHVYDDAKEAWGNAIVKVRRIIAKSGRELRTFGGAAAAAL